HLKGPNQRGGYGRANTLAQIFAEEHYTDRLLKLIQLNASDISFIDQYTKILKEEYPYELLDLYEQAIKELARQTGRKKYREVAGWLRKMTKITGGDEQAFALYKYFMRVYNN